MRVNVGVIQDSPVFFDKEKTLGRVEELLSRYAAHGCELTVFPESFIPGYPRGFSFGARVGSRTEEGRELYAAYHRNSIDLETEDLRKLEKMASRYKTYLVMGVTEKRLHNGSLYCSMHDISPTKGLLGVHR